MRNSSSSNSNITSAKYRDRFSRGSQYARLMGQGIWNPNRPMRMSPAEFRKSGGAVENLRIYSRCQGDEDIDCRGGFMLEISIISRSI